MLTFFVLCTSLVSRSRYLQAFRRIYDEESTMPFGNLRAEPERVVCHGEISWGEMREGLLWTGGGGDFMDKGVCVRMHAVILSLRPCVTFCSLGERLICLFYFFRSLRASLSAVGGLCCHPR